MLLDLAQFQNVQQNNQMAVTGQHMFGNLNTGAKSATQFLDTPDGQFSTVKNTNNMGKMMIQGNHRYENYTNNGATTVMPRKYPAPRRLEDLEEEGEEPELEELEEEQPEELEELASFNNYSNQAGGMTQIQGTHQFKNMTNAKKGKVIVLDHKTGQFSTFGNTNNMGDFQVAGLHKFDNTQNAGNFVVNPRTFDAKGRPIKLMDLASFNNFINKAGGNVQVTGTHAFKNINNEKKANFVFNDHKDGQFATVANMTNAGNTSFSGKHAVQNITNSGNVQAIPRKFKDKKKLLMDLAGFNNFNNNAGGMAQFQGTHQIKNMNNAVKGVIIFQDDRLGRASTVGNMNNAGQSTISGNHQFNNYNNSGQTMVNPRQFDAKGRPVKLMLI